MTKLVGICSIILLAASADLTICKSESVATQFELALAKFLKISNLQSCHCPELIAAIVSGPRMVFCPPADVFQAVFLVDDQHYRRSMCDRGYQRFRTAVEQHVSRKSAE